MGSGREKIFLSFRRSALPFRGCTLLDERVDGQPVHINRPVWPPCALPVLLVVETLGDVDIFPLCVEAGFVEIDL